MEERRIVAEERQTAALEKIAEYLAGGNIQPPTTAKSVAGNDAKKDVKKDAKKGVTKDVKKDKKIKPRGKLDDDAKRNIIRMIQARREAGLSFIQIASQFTDEKIPTFSGKGNWHPQTIRKIVKNAIG